MTRMAIVRAYFPEKAEDEQFKMVERLLLSKSGSTLYRPSCLRDVLTHLKGSPDMPKMDDLEQKVKDLEIQEAILARTGGTREAKAHRTPEAIKALRPPRDSCFLVMQFLLRPSRPTTPKRNQLKLLKRGARTQPGSKPMCQEQELGEQNGLKAVHFANA